MITVSTTSAAEARLTTDLFRAAPAWYDWRVYHMGTQVSSSADLRTWTGPPPEPGPERLHPAHERMRQLLAERGEQGYRAADLWDQLRSEDLAVTRETVHRWAAADEKKGYIVRTGKPVSRWVWAGDQAAGREAAG